jgi:DNA anti-recombination protein RmuC
MLNNLSGIGALQDALTTTNALLTDVLSELQETNAQRLEATNVLLADVLAELRETNSQRLEATNVVLGHVLAELKETNSQRLDEIAKEMQTLNEKVGKIPFTG